MAASLQGLVSGMVNVLTSGLISPALSGDTRWLAIGMVVVMAMGLACWLLYLHTSRRIAMQPATEPVTEMRD